MTEDKQHAEINEWLNERGHTPDEIVKILQKLAEFDRDIVRTAIFEDIDLGEFDIESIIKDAIDE
jgi:hypothetical protein